MAVNNETKKTPLAGIGITLGSANQSTYPIVYSDDVWDIVNDDNGLKTILKENGSYRQHEINESIAKYVKENSSGANDRIDEIEKNIEGIGDMEKNIQYLLEKTYAMNLNALISPSLLEHGVSVNDAAITFSVHGDTTTRKCNYKLYRKNSDEAEFSVIKNSFNNVEKEGKVGNLSISDKDCVFRLIAVTTGSIKIERQKDMYVSHVYPTYYGVVGENIDITSPDFTEILYSKKVIWGKSNHTIDFGGPYKNSKLVFAIPLSFGRITTLKDANNFDYINSYGDTCGYDVYTLSTHYLYVKKTAVTNNDKTYKLTLSWQ